jgi:LPXTG-site transpeptidase (sortase) family protein
MKNIMPKNMLVIGLVLVVFSFSSLKLVELIRQRNNKLVFPQTFETNNSKEVYPTRLEMSNLGIYLPISDATINKGTWEYSVNAVSYLKESPTPGNIGNSILYGHNWPNLLGPLKNVQPGDTLKIHFSNGEVKEFKAINVSIVTPDQTHILNQTEQPILTLYTCTGFLDSKRLVVVFIPVLVN